ncbi:helix-turn-helix domain-containing protein [Pedobacter aquatilis]|uniref:helix-turn-helix domain-containing protein n=1 Tax=Pedobacter aquatilis TaxID=351343 RepID=UPI00292D4DB7|nr:helix-turn-helix domain-containing protein [Pedobacter aquatilis]
MNEHISDFSFKEVFSSQSETSLFKGLAVLNVGKLFWKSIMNLPLRTDYWGVCLVLKGFSRVDINFKEYIFSENTIYFVSPAVIMEYKEYSDNIKCIMLCLDYKFFKEIDFPLYKIYSAKSLNKDHMALSLTDEQLLLFDAYFKTLQRKNLKADTGVFNIEFIKMTLTLIFYELLGIAKGLDTLTVPGFERKNKIVMDFLYEVSVNFRTHHEVQFYADKLFISRKHLSRVVMELTGSGPKSLINETIAGEALTLLNSTNMDIKDIMTSLNYHDFTMFSRFFKRYSGKSPQAFRKQSNE